LHGGGRGGYSNSGGFTQKLPTAIKAPAAADIKTPIQSGEEEPDCRAWPAPAAAPEMSAPIEPARTVLSHAICAMYPAGGRMAMFILVAAGPRLRKNRMSEAKKTEFPPNS